MDAEREHQTPRPEPDARPTDAELSQTSEPDAEIAPAYAAWRLDRPEERR